MEPNSRAERHTINLPEPLRDALRTHRIRQEKQRTVGHRLGRTRILVLPTVTTSPRPRRDWLDWKAQLEAAGVRAARVHDARHTAATLLLQQGVPARVAIKVLGQSQTGLTLGTYSHADPELAEEAAKRMGDALWS